MNRHENRPERLTIDVNIARDYLDSTRPGYADAVVLFQLAREGVVELATAPQGYALDVRGALREQLRAMLERENIHQAPQLAYASEETYPSSDLFPGAYVEGFSEAWYRIISTWRTHEGRAPQHQDRWHVETHLYAGRDVFVTNDKPLIAMCNRLHAEHGVLITAMSLAEYLRRREDKASTAADAL